MIKSVKAIIKFKGKYLLQLRDNKRNIFFPNFWGLFGGQIDKNETFEQIVDIGFERQLVEEVFKLMRKAEFKRRQAPPGVKVSENAFGRDWRYPISNKFVF